MQVIHLRFEPTAAPLTCRIICRGAITMKPLPGTRKCMARSAAIAIPVAVLASISGPVKADREIGDIPAPAVSIEIGSLAGQWSGEPVTVAVTTTGATAFDSVVRGCPGWGTEPGNTAGAGLGVELGSVIGDLFIQFEGENTVAAIIEGPDGVHHCVTPDDDGLLTHHFPDAGIGRLRVWPAGVERGETISTRVILSSRHLRERDLHPVSMDDTAPPRQGALSLDAGRHGVRQHLATGPIQATEPAFAVAADCAGHVNFDAPDALLNVTDQEHTLSLFAESVVDLVLMIQDPSGDWHCNDDIHGFNPAVTLSPAPAGTYRIQVGAYERDRTGSYELFASRGDPQWTYSSAFADPGGWLDGELGSQTLPAGGRLSLNGPDSGHTDADRLPLRLTARGTPAEDFRADCRGYMDFSRPDAILTVARRERPVTIYAASQADTAMLVRTPGGRILCNDDFDGLNPAIVMRDVGPGDYMIWVGTYDGFGAEATVGVTRTTPDWTEVQQAGIGSGIAPGQSVANQPTLAIGRRLTQISARVSDSRRYGIAPSATPAANARPSGELQHRRH